MKRNTLLVLIALIAAFSLMLTGCGGAEKPAEPEATAAPAPAAVPLGLASWDLSTSTWSSPNGATVHLTAIPNGYEEGQSASFIVRLEGDDVGSVACAWDAGAYTASIDLNAADGYCYYVALTGADGEALEVPVNTPAAPTNESVINLESALNSYCHLMVESSEADGKKLTLTAGSVQIQPPQITDDGAAVTCSEAVLVLTFNGAEVARQPLDLPAASNAGAYELSLAGIEFAIPAMEDDQQLQLRLDVTLSNGQVLTDANGTWSYLGGTLVSAVG